MSELNILKNAEALAILEKAVDALIAIGVPCVLAPMSLPQGMSISLHAGSTASEAMAAHVAATHGGEYAGAAKTHDQFVAQVSAALADPEHASLVRAQS